MSPNPALDSRLHIGAAYYPEHWPPERWPKDIELMKEAGLTVVRMAEFAWSTLEPAAGDFHFEWLDQVIDLLASAGIASVLGTPTAAPPAWLMAASPNVYAVDEHGRRVQFGNRCHYCVNSPDYHYAVQRIVQAMAEHFGPNPHVIGWQIDNEYGRVCYCDRCRWLFQAYLAEKYGTLEALNERWSTSYWSQTYSAWDQIPIPIGAHNPGLMLEFKRFITESYRRYQKLQLEVLRPHLPAGVWTTHNFMGWYDGFDHYILNKDLEFASWDWYVGSGHLDYLSSGAVHDLTRGFKQRNFWVMETQPGNVNWSHINNTLAKGEGRSMAWHAIAHGAEAVLYWQWRSALGGQEQYHGTLIDQSGKPRPFYEEVQQIAKEFDSVSEIVAGAIVEAEVAILNDYESRWSLQWQPHHQDFDYVRHLNHYYRPIAALNVPIDIISAKGLKDPAVLTHYKIIIAPALQIINDDIANTLRQYVSRGGRLILTARSAVKDEYNALLPSRPPGPFFDMAGIEVEEFYALDEPVSIMGNWFAGQGKIWAERLKYIIKEAGQGIASYGKSNGWINYQTAISQKSFGRGLVYYVGTYLDDDAQKSMLVNILRAAGIPMIGTPEGVEVLTRKNRYKVNVYFIINHTASEQTIYLPWPAINHLTKRRIQSELKLEPYGVAVTTRLSWSVYEQKAPEKTG
jgi:beta-galactosidase